MVSFDKLCLAFVLTSALSVGAQAQVSVSLANDFSLTNGNPNGHWTYTGSSQLLSVQHPVANGNPLIPALSNGYWGVGPDLYANTPDLLKAQVDGSACSETNNDFLAGDIVGHSPNDGSILEEVWTAPSAGMVTNLSFAAWYAHSVVSRANIVTLRDNNYVLETGTLANGQGRGAGLTYTYPLLAVAKGDQIAIDLRKLPGNSYGSLAGESLNFTFTATPEPLSIAALGLGVLAVLRKKRS